MTGHLVPDSLGHVRRHDRTDNTPPYRGCLSGCPVRTSSASSAKRAPAFHAGNERTERTRRLDERQRCSALGANFLTNHPTRSGRTNFVTADVTE